MDTHIIGHVHTCYKEKFGIPRQPGLVDEAWGRLVFTPEFRNADTIRGLEGFSHIWLMFIFHQCVREHWKPTVRPPRLGGNEKIGVFASRSPFRPNPIGLSAVKLSHIDYDHPDGPILMLNGVDLVDATPILDIKPYIPYSDALPDAVSGFATTKPERYKVRWEKGIHSILDETSRRLIESTLAYDPRPAYQHHEADREYGCLINGYNVKWSISDQVVIIHSCTTQPPEK